MYKPKRAWKHEGKYHWRCAPWTIGLYFIDGCSLYALSKDGVENALCYKDELEECMRYAREQENAAKSL